MRGTCPRTYRRERDKSDKTHNRDAPSGTDPAGRAPTYHPHIHRYSHRYAPGFFCSRMSARYPLIPDFTSKPMRHVLKQWQVLREM